MAVNVNANDEQCVVEIDPGLDGLKLRVLAEYPRRFGEKKSVSFDPKKFEDHYGVATPLWVRMK
jgi:hypothetical protein